MSFLHGLNCLLINERSAMPKLVLTHPFTASFSIKIFFQFSTFSGYINRLRGYYGISMKRSWYTSLDRKFMMQEWDNVNMDTYAKEWPDAWVGINADVAPSRDIF